jgi:putative ABC transport system permease protein
VRLVLHRLRLAARSFLRTPGFAAIAVLSLGLGIALDTTMYGVVDAMLYPEIDARAPEQLYVVRARGDFGYVVDERTRTALLRSGFHTYDATGATGRGSSGYFEPHVVEHGRRMQQARGLTVAPNYFEVLGAQPLLGRTLTQSDYSSGASPLLINDGLANTLFRDGESPLGKVVDVDGAPHVVIGVLRTPPGGGNEVWMLPAAGRANDIGIGLIRLRDGASLRQAESEMAVLSARFAQLAHLGPKEAWFELQPVVGSQFGFDHFDFALIASVVAILLIACANLANLQLARGIGRSRELAVRCALGASRRDIIAQLMLESALLAFAGMSVGVLLSDWGIRIAQSRIPPVVADFVIAPQMSWRVLAFAAIACVFCVLIIGLVPALRVSRVDPNELLKSGAGTGANRHHRRQYAVMVAVEIALSLAVLSGTSIVVQATITLAQARIGYDPKPMAVAALALRPDHDTTVSYVSLSNALLARAHTVSGLSEATVTTSGNPHDAVTANDPSGGPREFPAPMYRYLIVTPSYLRTYHRRVIEGRDFLDGVPAKGEVIIDRVTARFLWPNADPIGAQIKLGSAASSKPWVRVVGVVDTDTAGTLFDPTHASMIQATSLGAIYYLPSASDSARVRGMLMVDVVARTSHAPTRLPVALLRALHDVPPLRALGAESMEDHLSITRERQAHEFVASTFVAFSALAIGLAAIGIYGIVVHSITERRRELGVRIALGASPRQVLEAVLREGNVVALSGIALGLLLTKRTADWLYAFTQADAKYDAPLFGAMAAMLFVIVVVAALAPALRATRIDPVESLRNE